MRASSGSENHMIYVIWGPELDTRCNLHACRESGVSASAVWSGTLFPHSVNVGRVSSGEDVTADFLS